MEIKTFVGLIAGILTTTSFLPQVAKIWKSKSAKDISYLMFIILGVGIFLWLVYGILIESIPIIIANSVTFLLVITVLLLKLKLSPPPKGARPPASQRGERPKGGGN